MSSVKAFDHFTDQEVIQRILSGETGLYELLIRRNNAFLYRIGRSYGYSHHDVEDLMQETYISAYKSLSGYKNLSSFKTWLTRIMLNQCFQKKQKLSYQKEVLTENSHPEKNNAMFHRSDNAERTILNKELGHVLENALDGLPEDYRMVFALRELNGLSVAETAESMCLSETNVKARLSRAKGMLRKEIEKMYVVEDIYEFNLVYCDKIVDRVMSVLLNEQV
jgi:RNA polymerase sigma-70 factor (ECF subfamily)